MRQTNMKLDARERARLARTRVDQVRAEHQTIETNPAEVVPAGDERDTQRAVAGEHPFSAPIGRARRQLHDALVTSVSPPRASCARFFPTASLKAVTARP